MNTPWRIDEGFVLTCNGGLIGLVDEMGGLEVARRIVACVNACAEIETEKLEENISDPVAGLFGRIAARLSTEKRVLTAQRDELLAALKDVIYCSENFGKAYAGRDARDKAKALIRRINHA